MTNSEADNRAVYGLVLEGLPRASRLMHQADDALPAVTIRMDSTSAGDLAVEQVGPDRARMRLQGGGRAEIDRLTMTTALALPTMANDEEILHPFFTTSAAVFSRWLDRDAFHAGALVVGDGAWGVLGAKGAGKSTLMAWAAISGITVLTDDLLVVENGDVLVGPACIDLRPDAAAHLGVGEHLGMVGARERTRLILESARPARVQLRGWVYPSWGDSIVIQPVQAAARIPRLVEHLALRIPPIDATRLLHLGSLPSFDFQRPRSWDVMTDASAQLTERLAQAA